MRTKKILWVLPILAAMAWIATSYSNDARLSELPVRRDLITLPADGRSSVLLPVDGASVSVRVVHGGRSVHVDGIRRNQNGAQVVVRAGVMPGDAALELTAPGFHPARIQVRTTADFSDSFNDGTPDFLRLEGPDQDAFRDWFTLLAEGPFYQAVERIPAEIDDCAALLRFAYREALKQHDGSWASDLSLQVLLAPPEVAKYQYPFSPMGASVFRIKSGAFTSDDVGNGTFAQFADAETLRRYNTHFVSRDIRAAQRGDLLFYRQLEQNMPYHAMVFLGPSHFQQDSNQWIVYHTGPIGSGPGEIRRPSVAELLNHREPRWRPVPANSNFLGVYRWNILR